MMVGFSLNFIGLSQLIIILPLLHSQWSPVSGWCNSCDQDLWVWGFVSNPALSWSQSKELKSLCPHVCVIQWPIHPFLVYILFQEHFIQNKIRKQNYPQRENWQNIIGINRRLTGP
jgi:hypothetical protein